MANSSIIISDLRVASSSNFVIASWSKSHTSAQRKLSYLELDAVEIWASTVSQSDPTTGRKVAEGSPGGNFTVFPLDPGIYSVWARARDLSGNYGDWSNGVALTCPGVLYGANTVNRPAIRLIVGNAPTAPDNGYIWFDGTNVHIRVNGVNKHFGLIVD